MIKDIRNIWTHYLKKIKNTLKYTKRRSDKITLGQFIKKRLKEEKMTWKDLDIDTIDFFYQQYKVRNFKI